MTTPPSTLDPPSPTLPPPPGAPPPRARTPMMRVFAVVGVLFALVAVGWACFSLVDLMAQRTYHTSSSYPTVATLDLQSGDADVTVVPDGTDRIVVDRTIHRGLDRVAIDDVEQGGELIIRSSCHQTFTGHCSMSITIHTPSQIAVIGHLHDGNFDDRGTTGPVQVSSGDGDVDLTGVTGPVVLHSGDGDVTVHGLDAPSVDISSGDGDLSLSLANAPGTVHVATGDGDADVCLPRTSPSYAVDAHTGNGSLDNQIPSDPSADRHLTLTTGDGDATLRLC
jgi:hypothetical protein